MTATARIPRNLKKKLEASLQSLSPKEVGKLYAIYAHELDRKVNHTFIGGVDLRDYPPIKELFTALDDKVNKSRGKPEEEATVNQYNALVFIDTLFKVVNFDTGIAIALAFSGDSYKVMTRLLVLLQEDARTEMVRLLRDHFSETPNPISPEDYDRLITWGKTGALKAISDAASLIFEAMVETGHIVRPKEDIPDEDDPAWAAYNAIYDALAAKVETGELVGGEGLEAFGLDSAILIEAGTIPAWAALRILWNDYAEEQGFHIYLGEDYADFAPEMVDRVGKRDGEAIDPEALRKLAAGFYKDCRRRPWGKGLVANPDPDVLVNLLTQSSNPFLHLNPVDLGRVDWKLFVETEKDRELESEPVATVGSLNALDADFRRGETFDSVDWYRERYYPVSDVTSARHRRVLAFRMFDRYDRKTRQPFSFDRLEDGAMTMSEFMGVKFLTPLEEKVAELRKKNNEFASIRAALQTISDRYFGGVSVTLERSEKPLNEAADHLEGANKTLQSWTELIKLQPWNIDTSAMTVGEPEVDEAFAQEIVDALIEQTRNISRIREPEDVLFGKG